MRSLISATVVATALFACGQEAQDASSVAAIGGPQTLTWVASYLGSTDQGTVTVSPGGSTQITIRNMPAGQNGDMAIQLMSGNQIVYSGRIAALNVVGGNQLRRLSLSPGTATYSASVDALESSLPEQISDDSTSATYCGARFNKLNKNRNKRRNRNNRNDRFDNNFDNFDNFNNFGFNNGFNNGFNPAFNNGFNNGVNNGFNNGFAPGVIVNGGSPSAVTNNVVNGGATGVATGTPANVVAPKSGSVASLNVELVTPN